MISRIIAEFRVFLHRLQWRRLFAPAPSGAKGLGSDLYAASTAEVAARPYVRDFLETAKRACFARLDGIIPIGKS